MGLQEHEMRPVSASGEQWKMQVRRGTKCRREGTTDEHTASQTERDKKRRERRKRGQKMRRKKDRRAGTEREVREQ